MEVTPGGLETPSEMGVTGSTREQLPGVAGKPGELTRARTDRHAAARVGKAADLEGDAVRVGAHVIVAPIHLDARAIVGDERAAANAQEQPTRRPIGVVDRRVRARVELSPGPVGLFLLERYSTTRNSRKTSTQTRASGWLTTQLEMTTSRPLYAADA